VTLDEAPYAAIIGEVQCRAGGCFLATWFDSLISMQRLGRVSCDRNRRELDARMVDGSPHMLLRHITMPARWED
jgi:hypothetical protein